MKKKTSKSLRRYLALLLAAAISITAQAMPVSAESDGGQELRSSESSPANPAHHCTKQNDGSDTTDWNYVYFGSYPQTEITGDALTTTIIDASYDENGDAKVDGIKYRRISKNDTNHSGYFGNVEYRYFKWEQIKWRVLQNDGRTLFLVADRGLDCKAYHENGSSVTWENCTLRKWLNGEFYGMAFSSAEQGAVIEQDVVNEDNPRYNTEGGNDTKDNVYLLSIGEVTNPEYGFCENYDVESVSRRIQASDYAYVRGAWVNTGTYKGNCSWWTRSPGISTSYAAEVLLDGSVNRDGLSATCVSYACVPALHINLSSNLWFMADDGTSGKTCQHTWDAGKETKKPTCTGKGTKTYICTTCGEAKTEEISPTGHKYTTVTAKTTLSKDGSITKKCSVCGEIATSTAIARIQSVTLGKAKYVYNKKVQKPAVTAKDSKGKQIASKYYTVTYKNNKEIGKAAVTIRFKGNYEGTVTKTFQIVPKPTNITKVAAIAKGFQVAWKKQPESTTGYQIQYSTNKKFTKKATKAKTVKKASATKLAVKKLKAKKKYYVRIRTYKTAKGKNYYSNWSKTKTVKTGR